MRIFLSFARVVFAVCFLGHRKPARTAIFQPTLNKVREKEHAGPEGRPPYDVILMFKIPVVKSMYNLSDEKTEKQIRDRITTPVFVAMEMSRTCRVFSAQKLHGE